ncbi:MAG: TIGR00730 family Rossman fold protein [Acidimicrobiia bacterium]
MNPQPELPDPGVDELVTQLLDAIAPGRTRRHVADLIQSTITLAKADTDPLNLKIAAAALREMRDAFAMFRPHAAERKVAIFGSARTRHDDPLYAAARAVAAELSADGWMVITGAGPGIMQAGMEGAGRERSIGVSIRLPFEQAANPVIAGDTKYVSMKYFFTRKLMLIKEAKGFVCLPGGFGTLDETFELLTLTQTGKGVPVPIVFLDTPGDPYWEAIAALISDQLVSRGLVNPSDTGLFFVTDDHHAAVREITRFYRNYDSLRYVGDQLVIRLRVPPTDAQLDQLNDQFGFLCVRGRIERTAPLPIEVRDGDEVELARIMFAFAKHGFGDLRRLIDTVNGFVAAA